MTDIEKLRAVEAHLALANLSKSTVLRAVAGQIPNAPKLSASWIGRNVFVEDVTHGLFIHAHVVGNLRKGSLKSTSGYCST